MTDTDWGIAVKYYANQYASIDHIDAFQAYLPNVIEPLGSHLKSISKKVNPDYDIWVMPNNKAMQIKGNKVNLGIYAGLEGNEPSSEEITKVLEKKGALIDRKKESSPKVDLEKPESSSSKRKADTLEDKSPKKKKEV